MKMLPSRSLFDGFRENERLTLVFGRLLLAGMIVCLAVGIQRLVEQLATGWQGDYLPWLAGLIALEAVYTTGQVRRSREMEISPLAYRFVEWVVLLVLLKVFFYTRYGWDRLLSDLAQLGPGLFLQFFDLEYVLTAALLLPLWALTTWTMNDLFEIESAITLLDLEGYEKYSSNCAAIRNALANRLLAIGLLLAAVTSLVQADLSWLIGQHNAAPLLSLRGSGWYVLAYFVLLILLLGQTNFSTLRAGWAWERLPIDRQIASRWLVFGLLMLLLVGIGVSLLPTRYTLGILDLLRFILEWLLTFIVASFMLVFIGVNFLISWIVALFGWEYQPPEPQDLPEMPPFEIPEEVQEPISGSEFVQSLFFWVFLLAIAGFAFYQYVRQNKAALKRLQKFRLWNALESLFFWFGAWMKAWTQGAHQSVRAAVRGGLERLRGLRTPAPGAPRFNFLNPNRLAPRQRVLFYYLTLLRRGEEAGLSRDPDQTPQEYQQTLQAHLQGSELPSEVEPEQSALADLTTAFQEARYSRHPISLEQASRVKSAWAQIRQALRRREE